MVIPLTVLLVQKSYEWALVTAFVAAASDGIDGFLARRFGWRSNLGSILDPLADKLLLISCFFVLATQGWIPIWLLALIFGRDVVIVLGALILHYRVTQIEGEPSLLSKLNTFLQIALVLVLLLDRIEPLIKPEWLTALIWAVSVTTVLSGVHYVTIWSFKARDYKRANPKEHDDD